MGIVQVIIDDTASKIVTGTYEFNRDGGGALVIPSGPSFPASPEAKELFWRTDLSKLYRRNDANSVWEEASSSGGLSPSGHTTIRQLIHLADGGGPFEGFASGAYKETTGTIFPTAIVWYDQAGVGKKKIVEKLIHWTGAFPDSITWKVYDESETLLATVVDTVSYSGAFETSRTRSVT
jgi:hypothetical protein